MSIAAVKKLYAEHRQRALKRVQLGFARYAKLPSDDRKQKVADSLFGDRSEDFKAHLAMGPDGHAKLKTENPDVHEAAVDAQMMTYITVPAGVMAAACEELDFEMGQGGIGRLAFNIAHFGQFGIHTDRAVDDMAEEPAESPLPDAVCRFGVHKHKNGLSVMDLMEAIAKKEAAKPVPTPAVV